MDEARTERLRTFVEWVGEHVAGDEKGEAQLFLDRLLRAFGHDGVKAAGAQLGTRASGCDRTGTAFADLACKPYVLVAMKQRRGDLTRRYRQAFDHRTRLARLGRAAPEPTDKELFRCSPS